MAVTAIAMNMMSPPVSGQDTNAKRYTASIALNNVPRKMNRGSSRVPNLIKRESDPTLTVFLTLYMPSVSFVTKSSSLSLLR